jgi:hypothetical protein
MKKQLATLLALAAPAAAFADVELIAGFNFGQFVAEGQPSITGSSFADTGSIPSNYASGVAYPGAADSGISKTAENSDVVFSAGSGMVYFDGTNGSHNWTTPAVYVFFRNALEATNDVMVDGNSMYPGDDLNAQLQFVSGAATDFSVVVNTVGFGDFNPAGYAQPNDYNFTYAAYLPAGSAASIEWFYDNQSLGVQTFTPGVNETDRAFSVDLPAGFYGQSSATLVGRVTGNIAIDHLQINGVAVPEPSSFAAVAGAMALGFVASRRRRSI